MTELEKRKANIEVKAKIMVRILEHEAGIEKLKLQLACDHDWETFTDYGYDGSSDSVTNCTRCGWRF